MNKNTIDAKMYEALHSEFGLKAEWLGKNFKDGDKIYTITGLNPRSKKFPVLTDTGTSFSAPYVAALMTNSVGEYVQKRKDEHQKKTVKLLKEARANFPKWSTVMDIPKTWLDTTFKYGRTVYTIVGVDPGSSYPIVAQTSQGKVRFLTLEPLKKLLEKKAA